MCDTSDADLQWAFDRAFGYMVKHGFTDAVWTLYYRADQARRNGDRDLHAEELLYALILVDDAQSN